MRLVWYHVQNPDLSMAGWDTTQNTVISPNFLVWKFCGKAQFLNSFGRFAQNYGGLCLSTKFSHQEIRWNHDILRSEMHVTTGITKNVKTFPVMSVTSLKDQWNGTAKTINNYTLLDYFSFWVFFHKHSWFTEQQEKGEVISLTHLYHFHSLYR